MARHSQLDGLRGIAALIVVVHHWSLIVPGVRPRIDALFLPRLLVAGPQSVVVFFVLSGFVLFQAHERYGGVAYLRWCGWRAIRLGVPLAACVTLSALLALAVGPQTIPELSHWFNEDSWAHPVTALEWLRNVVPLDGRANHQLDNAAWSLSIEIRLSLLFPLLAIAVARSWRVTAVATFVLSLFMPANPEGMFDLAWTARYLFLFAAGAALSFNREQVADFASRIASLPLTFTLVAVACLGLIADPRLLMAPSPVVCAGAILLVAVAAFDPYFSKLLRVRPLVWLGRISFSLYLVHLPILLALVHLLHGSVPIGVLAIIAIPLTLAVAALLEQRIERPAISVSRRLLQGSGAAIAETKAQPEPVTTPA